MKLLELFDTNVKTVKQRSRLNTKPETGSIKQSKNWQERGYGSRAIVGSQTKDPHTVVKIGNNSDRGYRNFVEMIAQNDRAQSNPFFPRIYSAKHIEDPNSGREFTASYRMEKLQPFSILDSDQIKQMGDQLFKVWSSEDDETIDKTPEERSSFREMIRNDPDWKRETLIKDFTRTLSNAIRFSSTNIADPLLKQALMLIRTAVPRYGGVDIHSGNIMIRPTPHGPQLVITDPLV